jgi:hypothetical protein
MEIITATIILAITTKIISKMKNLYGLLSLIQTGLLQTNITKLVTLMLTKTTRIRTRMYLNTILIIVISSKVIDISIMNKLILTSTIILFNSHLQKEYQKITQIIQKQTVCLLKKKLIPRIKSKIRENLTLKLMIINKQIYIFKI